MFKSPGGRGGRGRLGGYSQIIRSLLGQASATGILSKLSGDLTAIAALTPSNDDVLQRKAGAWVNRSIAQLATDLPAPGVSTGDFIDAIGQLGLGVADALNIAQFVEVGGGEMILDEFDALTYVDVAGATNLDSGTAGMLKPYVGDGSDNIPTMTAATTSGITMAASSEFSSGLEAWRAGDNNNATFWSNDGSGLAGSWLKANLGAPAYVANYVLRARADAGHVQYPSAWDFQGSADGSSWTTIESQSGQNLSDGGDHTYALSAPAHYQYFKLAITSGDNASYVGLAKWSLDRPTGAINLTVASTAITAAAAPSTARMLIKLKPIDSITLNTDFIGYVSRDGGTTWTAATLSVLLALPGGVNLLTSNDLDISGQPSGTSMKWKLASANNKAFEAQAAGLYWRT